MTCAAGRRRDAEDEKRDGGGNDRLEDRRRRDAGDPHHRGGGVADHAPGAAGVGGGNDRGEITDVHLAAEKLVRHGAADQRRGDVVEKAGENPDHHQKHESAFPIVAAEILAGRPGTWLFSKCRDEQGEAREQTKQVGEDDPFVAEMRQRSPPARAGLEAGKDDLVERDRGQPAESDTAACDDGTAPRPSSVSPKRMKSTGAPKSVGRFGGAPIRSGFIARLPFAEPAPVTRPAYAATAAPLISLLRVFGRSREQTRVGPDGRSPNENERGEHEEPTSAFHNLIPHVGAPIDIHTGGAPSSFADPHHHEEQERRLLR